MAVTEQEAPSPAPESVERTSPEGDFAELDSIIEENSASLSDAPQGEYATDHSILERVRDSNGRFAKREQDPSTSGKADPDDTEIDESPVAAPVAQDAAPAEEFDAEFLARAQNDLGLSADEVRGIGDRKTLEQAMALYDRRLAQEGLRQLEAREPEAQPTQAAPQPVAPPPTQAEAVQAAIEKFKLEMNPEIYSEPDIKLFNDWNDHIHQQMVKQDEVLQALLEATLNHHESLTQFTSHTQADAQARLEQGLDTWFDSQGSEWQGEFGNGRIADMPADAPQRQNRIKVANQMRGLAAAEGKSVTADNLALYAARARGSLYYDQIHSRARQSITSQIDKRRGQVLSRPTGTNGKPASPDQAARQFVSQFMQTRGAADADDDFGL